MTRRLWSWSKFAAAWFIAGAGWDLQGRLLDHFLDQWTSSVAWLGWLQ